MTTTIGRTTRTFAVQLFFVLVVILPTLIGFLAFNDGFQFVRADLTTTTTTTTTTTDATKPTTKVIVNSEPINDSTGNDQNSDDNSKRNDRNNDNSPENSNNDNNDNGDSREQSNTIIEMTTTNTSSSPVCTDDKPESDRSTYDDIVDDDHRRRIPDDCHLVYAPRRRRRQQRSRSDHSSYSSSSSYFDPTDWGVFTLIDRLKGMPVLRNGGDIVIQWPFYHDDQGHNYHHHHDWTWHGRETGGQFEGQYHVESVVPGMAMLATSSSSSFTTYDEEEQRYDYDDNNRRHRRHSNILPLVPRVDEGGLTRNDSPGAGSITHYHNYTWWYSKDVYAGDELIVQLPKYHHHNHQQHRQQQKQRATERDNDGTDGMQGQTSSSIGQQLKSSSLSSSSHHDDVGGYCLDTMYARKSRIKGAGRGAFSSKIFDVGTVVAPFPMIRIHRNELRIATNSSSSSRQQLQQSQSQPQPQPQPQQLLLNYCFGRNDGSEYVYFPYAPMVNLINHFHDPNVKLQKSKYYSKSVEKNPTTTTAPPNLESSSSSSSSSSLDDEFQSEEHILLELVAIKPIKVGDELFLDYGIDWVEAWKKHVVEWTPFNNPDDEQRQQHYAPAYVVDDVVRVVRTEKEQKQYPSTTGYARNVQTTCFYRYSDRTDREKTEAMEQQSSSNNNNNKMRTFRWELTKGLYDLKNLRPCQILKRMEDSKGRSGYAARMLNHPSLPPEEQIPNTGGGGGSGSGNNNNNNNNEWHIVTHIPRTAIRFSDKPGTTDQHLPNAFRHEIQLPSNLDMIL